MRRRRFLHVGSAAGLAGLAGCTGLFQTTQTRQPPLASFRPNAVYMPTHVEGMNMVGMAKAGRRRVGVFYSYPHRFWTVTGTTTAQVELTDQDTMHLMTSVWDAETGTVLPVASGLTWEILQDGETVTERTPWPMISQNMGFHYGDNVSLDGDGEYTVRITMGGMDAQGRGAFEGLFGESVEVEVPLSYKRSEREQIAYTEFPEEQGQEGAVSPMQMEMLPLSYAPAVDSLSGDVLGEATSGDAVFVAAAVGGDDASLVVSPRTPHNGYVLPMMSLSATVERGGETVFDDVLTKAVSPELGYHYVADVALESGDSVSVTVDAPPQVSRHEGYETAFLDMEPVSFDVP